MKHLLALLLTCVLVFSIAGDSSSVIGWAGQIWPLHESGVTDDNPVDVYIQLWKGGVTDAVGQGAGLSATLYYGPTNAGPWTSVAMTYGGDIGNNDEYTAQIPVLALGGSEVWFYCEGYDSSDASTYTGAQDQNGHDPPHKLNVTPVLGQDVDVTFYLCMPPEGDPEYMADPLGVCLTGDHAEITNWGSGVAMSQPCPDVSGRFYTVTVKFFAGGNRVVQYKYRRNDCNDWENGGNHQITIDDSAPIYLVPFVDHWSYYAGDDCPGCEVNTEDATWGQVKSKYR
jgi:hypothetical protein